MVPAPGNRVNESCFAGPGEMAALMRTTDWSRTPLGPVAGWSYSLRMMVSFLLANRFPLLLWWGPLYASIYNDAYRPVLGTKHPKSLGQPASECWAEIWHILQPLIDTPYTGGPATWMEDLPLEVNRYGFLEETHFTVAYSPVPDDTAPRGIGGVLATVHEITEKVVAERRVAALRDIGAITIEAGTLEDACAAAAASLSSHTREVPFALIYLIDQQGAQASLTGAVGVTPGEPASPATISLDPDGNEGIWPLAASMRDEKIVVVDDLASRFESVPPGPWADPPHSAVIVPVRSNTAHRLAGFLVAGVSPRLRLDDVYTGFFELIASQIATAIATARAYQEERKRAEALAEIDRAKTLFFSNVSHEFRTPLTLMLGPLEDELAEAALPERDRERLEVAHRNSLRLLKLVNSLLDFSRIEAGRAQASYEPVDLAALTIDLASNFRSAFERAGIDFTVDCSPLPQPVNVDREMWEKIVLNLLSNAFKFTFEGGVAVMLRAESGAAELAVRDTGVGIPEGELPRLFERFHRIEGQRSRTYEGSGIGLALVQELVNLHGGTIRADSAPDRGTTLTVRIPFGTAHLPQHRVGAARGVTSTAIRARAYVEEALRWLPDDPADDAAANSTGAGGSAGKPPFPEGARIVLADDNADMRGYVRRLLGNSCEVETAADGEAALEIIRQRRPDLVLADVMMPRLDGFGLLRAIRADPRLRDLPVIMLSARAGEESRVDGIDAGADDYLVKPFPARELVARIGTALALSRGRRESTAALRDSEERLRALVQASSDVIYRMSPDWSEMRQLWGRNFIPDTIEPSRDWLQRYISPEDQPLVLAAIDDAISRKDLFELEHRVRRGDGTLVWILSRAVPLLNEAGGIVEWFGTASDITERKGTEQNLLDQRRVLEMVATGMPLAETLGEIMLLMEHQEPGIRCGLLVVDDDGEHFRASIGPNLPPVYHSSLEGAPIAPPYLGSYGETAHCGVPVTVPDIAAETRYSDSWRELLLSCGLRAARSTPVHGSDGRVLGSLAIYHDHPCDPMPADSRLLESGTYLATIALERDRADADLRRNRQDIAAELAATQHLQAVSTELIQEQGVERLYEKIVEAAAAIMRADYASLQMLYPERGNGGELRLIASRGFSSQAAQRWRWVRADWHTSCAVALRVGKRVVVPDIERCDFMAAAEDLATYRQAGIQAMQSTPLVSRSGRLVGMISTHWCAPREPSESDLRRFDVLARQAADLIERNEAEATLRQSRENLTAALAASNTGTFRWDPRTGEYSEFDDNLKCLFGFALDEPVRRTEDFIARVHPDDAPALVEAVDACRSGADFEMEYRVVLPDGGIRWLYDRARMERDAAGKPVYLVGACTDITKRKEAERQLRDGEEQFRTLADSIPQLCWIAEPDGAINWYNRGWYEYTGTAPEEMRGWGWQAVHDPETLPAVLERWQAALATGAPFEMVFPLRGGDGTFRPFLTRAAPVRGEDGRITRWFGSNTDISGQREIQDTLRRLTRVLENELELRSRALETEMAERRKAEEALQQAQRLEAIGQLTGGVAHDFNNLLTVVTGHADGIAAAAHGSPRIARMAGAIQRAAERGARLTAQLLAFSRRQRLRPVTATIDELLADCGELVRRAVGETIEVHIEIGELLWPIAVDTAQFESAILNLAINARDAMPQGGRLTIAGRNATVRGAEAMRLDLAEGGYLAISVSDTGTGMPPDVRDRAFEPFFTTKDVGKGTGLGLAQIYGFAKQSGGSAAIDTEVGRGTSVSLYLPRAQPNGAADVGPVANAAASSAHDRTVLLVEDQAEVREVIEMTLKSLGYRVLTAPDGVAARLVLEGDEPIDLLLTDIVMPNDLSGTELAETARQLRPALRVVLVSGYSRYDGRAGNVPEDAVFLAKPFRQDELVAALAAAFGEPARRSFSNAFPARPRGGEAAPNLAEKHC